MEMQNLSQLFPAYNNFIVPQIFSQMSGRELLVSSLTHLALSCFLTDHILNALWTTWLLC
jgi:hypothetical protein